MSSRSDASDSAGDEVCAPCPLLKHLPGVRKTGDTTSYQVAVMNRKRLCDIITLAWEEPDLRADAVEFMQAQRDAKRRKSGVVMGLCFVSVSVMSALENKWRITFWCQRLKVTATSLGEAAAKDASLFKNSDMMFHGITSQCQVPQVCISQVVLERTLVKRAKALGDRYNMVTHGNGEKAFISPGGDVDWSQGLYDLVWEEGVAVAIKHRPSGVVKALDTEVQIGAGWSLSQNYSEMNCKLEKGRTSYPVTSFFLKAKREGPHDPKYAMWMGNSNQFKVAANIVNETIKAHASTSASALQDTHAEAFNTPIKQRAADRAKDGLAKLAQKKKERSENRKVVLRCPA